MPVVEHDHVLSLSEEQDHDQADHCRQFESNSEAAQRREVLTDGVNQAQADERPPCDHRADGQWTGVLTVGVMGWAVCVDDVHERARNQRLEPAENSLGL